MKCNRKTGFSILEVIAAVVIFAVVAAATVATVAPLRQKSEEKLVIQEMASLNAMAQTYFLETGEYPGDLMDMVNAGYIPHCTPAEQTRVKKWARYAYTPDDGVFRRAAQK